MRLSKGELLHWSFRWYGGNYKLIGLWGNGWCPVTSHSYSHKNEDASVKCPHGHSDQYLYGKNITTGINSKDKMKASSGQADCQIWMKPDTSLSQPLWFLDFNAVLKQRTHHSLVRLTLMLFWKLIKHIFWPFWGSAALKLIFCC